MASREGTAPAGAGFEPLEHGADIGLRVWAPTLAELFRTAAIGMYALMASGSRIGREESVGFELSSDDVELLLADFLNELLYYTDTKHLLFADVQVDLVDGTLRAEAVGERFDPARHTIDEAIKAATYHMLAITRTERGYEATVIFDV